MNWIHEFCLFLDGMHKLSVFSCALCALLLTGRRLFLIMFHSQVDIWFVCGLIASSTRECTEGHCVTFFGKQIGCLHIQSEREKGNSVLWTSLDEVESTLWEKCLLLRRDWTLKYSTTIGVRWNWPHLLVSLSLKTPTCWSCFSCVFQSSSRLPLWNKQQELFFYYSA